jgi:hypothetical protein
MCWHVRNDGVWVKTTLCMLNAASSIPYRVLLPVCLSSSEDRGTSHFGKSIESKGIEGTNLDGQGEPF